MEIHIKNMFLKLIVLLTFINTTSAQNPNWVVNDNDFEYTMTFVASLNLDGVELSNTDDQLAAFVGSELRGVANLTYVTSVDRYFAYLTTFANTNGETLSFKIYDSLNNEVRDVSTSIMFEINAHHGSIFQSVSFADPLLNNESDILSFSFNGIATVSNVIDFNNHSVSISVDENQSLTSLAPEFTLSSGATLYIGSAEQASGVDSADFNNPVIYSVLSQDNSVLQDWVVTVNRVSTDIQYYKKDAVCYENGAIRVITTENFAEPVRLFLNGTELLAETFTNGEVVFSNLGTNSYEVRIGNIIKNIDILFLSN